MEGVGVWYTFDMDEDASPTTVTGTILADDNGRGSTTRLCITIGYITFSVISIMDCLFHRGLTSNSITVCAIMLGGGAFNYITNTYKNLKKKEAADG